MTTTARLANRVGVGPRALESMRRGVWIFFAVTIAGAAFDLFTKWWAVERLPKLGLVTLTERLGLLLVFNHGTAGGYSVGEHTMLFNIIVMSLVLVAVTLCNIMLSGIDAWSAVPMGMIAGGGWGNLASVVAGPTGVPDFLAWQRDSGSMVIFNVADVVLWFGCALLIPIGIRLARLLQGDQRDVRSLLRL